MAINATKWFLQGVSTQTVFFRPAKDLNFCIIVPLPKFFTRFTFETTGSDQKFEII